MADFGREATFGERVKAIRRARGFKSARALAASIAGGTLTESIIENIEAGRREDVTVSQLFSLAMALRVPPTFLLTAIGTPTSQVDLANLSDAFHGMTAGEFDAWLASVSGGDYRARTADERWDRRNLESYRELASLKRRLRRVSAAAQTDPADADWRSRIDALTRDVAELETRLRAEGWDIPHDSE